MYNSSPACAMCTAGRDFQQALEEPTFISRFVFSVVIAGIMLSITVNSALTHRVHCCVVHIQEFIRLG